MLMEGIMNKEQEHMKEYWNNNTKTLERAMYIVNSSKKDWVLNDFLESGKKVWTAIYDSVKDHLPDKFNVLDVGCGLGRVLYHAKKEFEQSYGVDIDEGMIKHAKGIQKDLNLEVVDGTGDMSMIFDDSISFVFSFICFQHIPYLDVQQKYIKEIERVLKPGGIAGLLVQNIEWCKDGKDISLGRGLSLEELKEVTSLKVVSKDDKFLSHDNRNYWIILKK